MTHRLNQLLIAPDQWEFGSDEIFMPIETRLTRDYDDNEREMFPEKKQVEFENPKAWMCRNA